MGPVWRNPIQRTISSFLLKSLEVMLTMYPPYWTGKHTTGRNMFSIVFYLPRQLSNSPSFQLGGHPKSSLMWLGLTGHRKHDTATVPRCQYSHPARWHTSRLQASTANCVVSLSRNTNIKQRTLLPINCRQHSADIEEIGGSSFVLYTAVNFSQPKSEKIVAKITKLAVWIVACYKSIIFRFSG